MKFVHNMWMHIFVSSMLIISQRESRQVYTLCEAETWCAFFSLDPSVQLLRKMMIMD